MTIAVIDSGIDAFHPEISGAVLKSFDALGRKKLPIRTALQLLESWWRIADSRALLHCRVFWPSGHSGVLMHLKALHCPCYGRLTGGR